MNIFSVKYMNTGTKWDKEKYDSSGNVMTVQAIFGHQKFKVRSYFGAE